MGSGGRTLSFTMFDDLLLVVHAPLDPDPREWDGLMEASRSKAHIYRRCLVCAGSVKLQARQRSELADFVNTYELRVAVLVESALARGMVTALGWVTGKYRAFGPDDVEGAVVYLGGNIDVATVRDEIRTMRKAMQLGQAAAG